MATQEFYIRNAGATEARGPFTQEQLSSLAEAGQVGLDTLYYEGRSEKWIPVGANADLKASLFPEKKKLTIKAKTNVDTLNIEKESQAPITVNDMLAAAEGKTADTKHAKDPSITRGRAAKIGLYACILFLFVAAAAEILPSIDVLMTLDPNKILSQPLIFLGAIDLVLSLLLLLQMVTLYPFVRFRAALGLGFIGFLFWVRGEPAPLLAVAAGSAGIYLSTIFLDFLSLGISVGLGLAGMLGFAYYMLMT
ncbi:MAG TPA: hypothetical protein VNW23_03600 [Opitutaceae bacterium]|nr:hypothetical protein [Opitutaceae bacterium]HXA14187.1 hypothetical protein [Opitutaceae bacterium]